MLDFKPITIDDKEIIEKFTKQKNYFLCSFCFVDLFIWADHYKTQFCVKDDFLFIKSGENENVFYAPPLADNTKNCDFKAALEEIEKDANERKHPFKLAIIPEELKEEIEMIYPNRFEFNEEIDTEDYIYLAESLISLKGKKLHSKRNYINRFTAEYDGRWEYEELTDENKREIFEFHLDWCGLKDCEENESFLGETCAISKALKNYKRLELKGGIIRLDGKIIAFSLGSKCNDELFVVQIEKANSEIAGAYQMINQQFASHNCQDVMYIDREEDLGIEGLRRAKKSYYPVKMGVNYSAKLK